MRKILLALCLLLAMGGGYNAHATALQLDFFLSAMLDVSGDPLSGAIVVTKNSAGSAAKAVWEDRDQTLPSSLGKSQFSLDSEGRAEVFGSGIYTVIIYDEDDTGLTSPLYTFSGVEYNPPTQLLDDLAGASVGSGSDLVAHTGTADTVTETLDDLLGYSDGTTTLDTPDIVSFANSAGVDTDVLMVADSDSLVASQKASKAYTDTVFADVGYISGDDTAGRVLRVALLTISDGTTASTIKATLADQWNGDVLAEVDNIAKGGGATGGFTLSGTGTSLSIAVSGDAVATVSGDIITNSTSTDYYQGGAAVLGQLTYTLAPLSGAFSDLTLVVDAGTINSRITYVTSE